MELPDWIRVKRPAPPEALAFGGLWASLLDFALVVVALVWAIDAFAPPQDLPWKPLRLSQPPGLATAAKFERAAQDPELCRQILEEGGVDFTEEPDRRAGDLSLIHI